MGWIWRQLRSPGSGFDAAAILTGATGAQSYSNVFDVSSFTTASDAMPERADSHMMCR
jgi:hypothetical protein